MLQASGSRGLHFRLLVALLSVTQLGQAQRQTGELRVLVFDSAGGALPSRGLLESQATRVRRLFETDPTGQHTFQSLPFGPYRLQVESAGFSPQSILIQIDSESPLNQRVTLRVAPLETSVVVHDVETLIDPGRTGSVQYLGPEALRDRRSSTPGRSVIDLVDTQPGWLLEANGVLHPRGSEYDVQYVIDGVPLYDNRSPAFSQSLGIGEFEAMTVRTGAIPAEFGRKMGGVIELATERDTRPGLHGSASLEAGSFSQLSGFTSLQFARGKTTAGVSGEGMMTDRYLDPPVIENFTNHGSGGAVSARLERDWSEADRTRLYFQRRRTGFLVPNELLQQTAGQRQDRDAGEWLGQVSHQRIFSPRVLSHARAMVRDTRADLWSNLLSTPILPSQNRGFREVYAGADVTVNYGKHEFKTGGELLFDSISENFSYHIMAYRLGAVRVFDSDLPRDYRFSDRRQGRDQSGFVQDRWRRGNFTLSAGLRLDHHRIVEDESAWSPRLGAAYSIPSAGLVLRASYDRIFSVPAIENVLMASVNQLRFLGGSGAFLPLHSARGNYYEAGFSKSLSGKLRLDGAWYRRHIENFADDSLLLNTGVSFPTAFSRGEIDGYEAKLEMPRWGRFSGFASYSHMVSFGRLPAQGGLFLGDDAGAALDSTDKFPISQDQRNTLRSRVRVQAHPRVWFALGGAYNSGLPFEIEGPANPVFTAQQYGPRIISKVNFDRGRVRPSASIDFSAGADIYRSDKAFVRLQGDVLNLGDRLNLVNFSGLFSGTAVEAGRSFAIRLRTDF